MVFISQLIFTDLYGTGSLNLPCSRRRSAFQKREREIWVGDNHTEAIIIQVSAEILAVHEIILREHTVK